MSDPRSAPTLVSRHALITQRLRQRRDDLGLTQKQIVTRLAKCGLQTTNRALSSLEHGAGLDVAKLPELAIALNCTVTYLLGLTEDPHSWEPSAPSDFSHASSTLLKPPDLDRAARLRERATPVGPVGSVDPVGSAGESLILGSFFPERRRAE